MDEIRIKGLEIFANHGVFEEENVLGQKFVVNATLYTDISPAAMDDEITKSIHYGEVSLFIKNFMKKNTFKLIESAVEKLSWALLCEFEGMKGIELEIEKPWAPVKLPLKTVSVNIKRFWHKAYIAIGSNMGDKEDYLKKAVEDMKNILGTKVTKVSDFIITKPYGGVEQDDFINGAVEIETLLSPTKLLDELHKIENRWGRKREIHWGPRTLDLDILMYDKLVYEDENLIIPHVEMHKRDFVLEPMVNIAPNLRHPICNKTMSELYNGLKGV